MTPGLRSVDDIFYIFAPFYAEVREIGFAFLFVFLVLALLQEFLNGIQGKTNYRGLFIRGLLITGLFVIYTPFFREVTHGMQLMANFFMPSEEFNETVRKVFTAYKQHRDLGMMAFLKMSILEWAMQGTYNLAYWVIRIFNWVRLVFLSALYISGPIFLGVGIFQPRMSQTWVRWIFEVSAWNVVLSLFMRVLTQLDFFELYQSANTPLLDLVAMNLVMILIILFFVPTFSAMMIRGAAGFSGAGGAVLGLGSALLLRQGARGIKGMNLVMKKPAYSTAKNMVQTGRLPVNKSYKGVR